MNERHIIIECENTYLPLLQWWEAFSTSSESEDYFNAEALICQMIKKHTPTLPFINHMELRENLLKWPTEGVGRK